MALSSPQTEQQFMRLWQRRGVFACLLWPLSLLFGLVQWLRRRFYALGLFERVVLPLPVIVVGNIFVGGTGKTPLVIWLVQQLRAQGFTPGVLSRGYGGAALSVQSVTAATSPDQAGDEPVLIAQKTSAPLMIGRDRVAAARALMAAHPEVDVIVADDGLQHYRLARTIEIQLSDTRGVGNGWLLPAGPLREPASRRSDFYVCNGAAASEPHSFRMQLDGACAEQLLDRSRRIALSDLAPSKRVAALAGIGDPARFFAMLGAHGVRLSFTRGLPDHFDFSVNPFVDVDADLILITEKDAVKCAGIPAIAHDARLWVVPVQATIESTLAQHIVEKLRGHPTA